MELALRTTLTASLREGDAAAVRGHHAEVGHSHPVTMQRGQSEVAKLGGVGRGRGDIKGRWERGWRKQSVFPLVFTCALDHHHGHQCRGAQNCMHTPHNMYGCVSTHKSEL